MLLSAFGNKLHNFQQKRPAHFPLCQNNRGLWLNSKLPRVSQLMRNWSKSIREKQLSPEFFAWYPGCDKTGTYIDTIHHSLHGKINDTFSIRKQKQVGSQNSVSRNFQKPVNTVEGTSPLSIAWRVTCSSRNSDNMEPCINLVLTSDASITFAWDWTVFTEK